MRAVLAVGVAAVVVLGPTSWSGAAAADGSGPETDIAGVELPAGVRDISDPEVQPRTQTTADEVVVAHTTGDGNLAVTTLEAASPGQAQVLSAQIDAEPAVVAEVNSTIPAPQFVAESAATPGAEQPNGDRTAPVAPARRSALQRRAIAALDLEPYGAQQWALSAINAPSAWARNQGENVVVAVLDGTVDETHPDLAGRLLPRVDMVGDGLDGIADAHATHVAGIIGADANGLGVVGVAPSISILPVRVCDPYDCAASDVANGIIQATDMGAQVLSISLGGPYDRMVDVAVRYAISRGVTVVACSGNEYDSGNPVEYPAALPGVLTVSASTADGGVAAFSNSGSYVDLSAPGVSILSTVPGAEYAEQSGTSMAAPHVAAAAAMVRSVNPGLTKPQVDQILTGTARDQVTGNGWDNDSGAGLLQADAAVALAATVAPAAPGQKSASVKASATRRSSVLTVDVDPNRKSSNWRFWVQQKAADGTWVTLPKRRTTSGAADRRSINLKAGTYRVVVADRFGYTGTTSNPVVLYR